jgi:chromosome segregation ATPase
MPEVRLEVLHGAASAVSFEMVESTALVGTVPGCDVRLPGSGLPPVIALITRAAAGVGLRKLVPTQPVLVNGKPVSMSFLADGDRIGIGPVELTVHIQVPPELERLREKNGFFPPAPFPVFRHSPQELDERARELEGKQKSLEEQTAELETDRIIWYRRREELEQECQQFKDQERALAAARNDLEKREKGLKPEREELDRIRQDLDAKAEKLAGQEKELTAYRQQLDERYRERRDRLAGLQEAVNKAAANMQERKRRLEAELKQMEGQLQDHANRQAALDAQAQELKHRTHELEEQRQHFNTRQEELQKEFAARLADCQTRERQLVSDRQTLENDQAKYQADLLRLDRLASSLEQRQKQLEERAQETDRRFAEMQQASREMEEHAKGLKEWETRLLEDAEKLTRQKAEQEAVAAQTAQRAAALESQQALLVTLRSQAEKLRDDLRREEQGFTEQHNRQQEIEADLQRQVQEVQRLRSKWEEERRYHDKEGRQFQERVSAMETAVAKLRDIENKLAEDKESLDRWAAELQAQAAKQAEEGQVLEARSSQLVELQKQLADDRQALRDRETTLIQAEQAREALQEQLRKRSEELAVRQRELDEQAGRNAEEEAAFQARRAEFEQQHQEKEESLAALRQELETRSAELGKLQGDLSQREETLTRDIQRLKAAAQKLGADKKALSEERRLAEAEQESTAAELAKKRVRLESIREEVAGLHQKLPELEQRAQEAGRRMVEARRLLRDHLAEMHSYASQAQEDLENLRAQVRLEADQLRQQETFLHKGREDQRLAVAAFRQQLLDYQAQLEEMKRTLLQDESRLERRQAEVDEAARRIDATSARLAKQAEQIQEQEKFVAERRDEMERHLADMREWYRRKLRELAEEGKTRTEDRGSTLAESPRHILPFTEEVDEVNLKLGLLLQSYELIEAETLSTLLREASRQRQSLRQILLSSGLITLYQMALIEAGNLDGLVLGPLRVMDRLRLTAHETVYRVFDPRRTRGGYAILRHLAENEMPDPSRAEEFRRSFAAAVAVVHPNLAATWEVLDISGRPAVLQEWLTGLPSSDWPSLATVPEVWYRLLRQAAEGLQTAHEAGLIHGHLDAGRILLTAEGVLKIAGFGEPDWLVQKAEGRKQKAESSEASSPHLRPVVSEEREGEASAEPSGAAADSGTAPFDFGPHPDVAVLAQIAVAWVAPVKKKGTRAKALPKPLRKIAERLKADDPATCYPNMAALLADLTQISDQVPDNAEAWDNLLGQIRDQGKEEAALKQSA